MTVAHTSRELTIRGLHHQVPLNPNGNHPDFPTLPDGSGRDVLFDWKLKDTWKQMEDLLKTGKVKSIGVSNFSQKKLEEEILPYATVVPAVDQVCALSLSPICSGN